MTPRCHLASHDAAAPGPCNSTRRLAKLQLPHLRKLPRLNAVLDLTADQVDHADEIRRAQLAPRPGRITPVPLRPLGSTTTLATQPGRGRAPLQYVRVPAVNVARVPVVHRRHGAPNFGPGTLFAKARHGGSSAVYSHSTPAAVPVRGPVRGMG